MIVATLLAGGRGNGFKTRVSTRATQHGATHGTSTQRGASHGTSTQREATHGTSIGKGLPLRRVHGLPVILDTVAVLPQRAGCRVDSLPPARRYAGELQQPCAHRGHSSALIRSAGMHTVRVTAKQVGLSHDTGPRAACTIHQCPCNFSGGSNFDSWRQGHVPRGRRRQSGIHVAFSLVSRGSRTAHNSGPRLPPASPASWPLHCQIAASARTKQSSVPCTARTAGRDVRQRAIRGSQVRALTRSLSSRRAPCRDALKL